MEKKCPYLEGCRMYKYLRLQSLKEMYITHFCQGNFEECQRKKLRDSGQMVPDKLLPTGAELI